MTVWHVQRLYCGDEPYYCVLPYNLKGTVEVTMQMEKRGDTDYEIFDK